MTSIFIKSYPSDFPWLEYALKSIHKQARGFSEVVVVAPEVMPSRFINIPLQNLKWIIRGDHKPGYMWQQCCKISADTWTDTDYIAFMDSDCVLTRPFHCDELFDEQWKPKLLREPWEKVGEAIAWKPPTDKALGVDTKYEAMRCHPGIYRRQTLQAFREHVQKLHGVDANTYILSQPAFSEFNALGNYVLHFEPEKYAIIDCRGTEQADGYPRPLKQYHSWGGISPQIRAEMESLCA